MAGVHFSLVEVSPGVAGVFQAIEAIHALFEEQTSCAIVPKGTDLAALRLEEPSLSGEPSLIVLTSGTTGNPRAVEIPFSALAQSAESAALYMQQMAVWLTALPVTSMGGLNTIVRSAFTGIEPVIWDGVGGAMKFEPENFVPFIKAVKTASLKTNLASAVSLVSTQLFRLALDETALTELAELDFVLVGGGGITQSLKDECINAGVKIVSTYGATETVGGCVFNGAPLAGYEINIVDDLVHIKSENLAWGYRDGESINGNWRSKDRGEFADGKLQILGRSDSIIKVAGVAIDIQALETQLQSQLPNQNIVVVAIADSQYGNVPLVVSNIEIPNIADISHKILNQALPVRFKLMSQIPMLQNGKPDRISIANN
jgi:O-succinylbenzoic acid--CoA ligase